MRRIEVSEGLHLRFPGRDDEFDDGVEIGLLLAALEAGGQRIHRTVSEGLEAQVRALADAFGYRMVATGSGEGDGTLDFVLLAPGQRPPLRVVRS